MEFAILGPIEVRRDGRSLELGGPKQRSLLACLLLHANQVVPRDVLVETLWGEAPPPGASRSLDSHVSRLRGLLDADRLIRTPPGYVLAVEPGELDLDRFEELVEQARACLDAGEADAAAEKLRAALGLWRGHALADLVYEPIGREADSLQERRLDAIEDRIEADLCRGLGQDLVPELEELVREHPSRERLVGHLMLVLYRAGRQSDALNAYARARRRLGEELGLEPGPQLRALEQRILRHDPTLEADTAGSRSARSPHRRFPVRILALGLALAAAATAAILLLTRVGGHSGERRSARTSSLMSLETGSRAPTAVEELEGIPAAIATGKSAVWIADPSNRQVLRADPSTGRIVDRIALDGQPNSLAVGQSAVWAASTLAGSISRIDPATDEVTQTIRLGGADAAAIAFGGAGLWVADATDQALIRIDETAGEAAHTISIDARPSALAVDAANVWVADHDAGRVFAVDARSGDPVAVVQVGGGPTAMKLGFGALWVANELDSTLSRIDLATGAVVATIPVGSGPAGIAISDGFVWVANRYAGTVSRIDPRSNDAVTIAAADQPAAIAAAGSRLWIASGPASGAHRGGRLTIATTNRFFSIDPAFQTIPSPNQWGKLAYDTLVTFRTAAGSSGLQLVPDLAVALPLPANGGTTYAFRLRRGIRYSNGAPLRAADFRRAIERLFRVGSQGADYFSGVVGSGGCRRSPATCDLSRGIRTDDAGTVVFRLTSPDPDFLYKLTPFSYSAPVPAGTPDRDVRSNPVPGTGPYRLLPWHGGTARFERNPYFQEWSHAAQPDGKPDAIVWRFYPSFAAEVGAVERGEADWIFGLLPPDRLRQLQLTVPGQLHVNATFIQDFIPLNAHLPPFDDVRVRRALNLAIDRARIVRMYGGPSAATLTCQPLPRGFLGYRRYCPYSRSPAPDGAWRGPDLARARRLVAASGTKGQLVDVWGATDGFLPRELPAYVASVLRSLGYRTKLHLAPGASITYAMRRSFQLSVDGSWLPDYPKPSSFLPQFFGCGGGYTNGYVCDPALDRKMQQATALQVRDPGRAAAVWAEVDRRIVDRAYWVPLVNSHSPELVSKRLGNFQYNPIWDFIADQAWVR